MSQHSKEYCNKVEELEEETSAATKDEEDRIKDYRDKEIYVTTEFRTAENDKLCCNKVFMSRHKLDNFSITMSRHYQSLS